MSNTQTQTSLKCKQPKKASQIEKLGFWMPDLQKSKIILSQTLNFATLQTFIAILTMASVACWNVPTALAASLLYVVSDRTDSVLKYDLQGNFLGVLDDRSHSGFNGAIGLALDRDGNLYLSRGYSNTIERYNPVTQTFDVFTSGGSLASPHQFAFGGLDNDLYVANHHNGTVQRFDGKTGVFKSTIASDLGNAVGLTIDSTGNIYVTSRDRGTVYKYDGTTLSPFVSEVRAEALLFGPDGYIYVSQNNYNYPSNGSILRYKTDGTPFGVGGNTSDPTFISGNGQISPQQMAFGIDGNFYFADYLSNQVLRYNGSTGEFIDVFTKPGYNIEGTWGLAFSSDSSESIPEPTSALSLLALGVLGAGSLLKRKQGEPGSKFN